jgi:methyl-accepting chemotaxis protein
MVGMVAQQRGVQPGRKLRAHAAIPEGIQAERSASTKVLTTAEPSAADRSALTEARRRTDQAFDAALAGLSGDAGAGDVGRGVAAMRREIEALRGRIDPAQQLPPAERLRVQPDLSTASQAIQANANPLIDAIQRRLAATEPSLGEIASVARLVADLREAASLTTVPAGPGIRQRSAMTADELARVERRPWRLRRAPHAAALHGRDRRRGEPDPARLCRRRAQRARGAACADYHRHDGVQGRRPYSIPAAEWTPNVSERMTAMFAIRDAALRELAEQGARQAGAARTRVFTLAGVVVVGLALLASAAFVFQRKVLAALERIAGLMGDVAKGDFSVTIPDTARKDEVGQIATALAVFKDNGLRMQALDAEQKSEQAKKEKRQTTIDMLIAEFDRSAAATLEKTAASVKAATSTARA